MMRAFFVAVVCALLMQSGRAQSAHGEDSTRNLTKEETEDSKLSHFDSFGNLAVFIDNLLSQLTSDMPPPKKSSCSAQITNLGEMEITVSQQPHGSCSYCCRVNNYAKYVRLYSTSKANGGKLTEMKMKRKRGALRSVGVNSTLPTIIYIHGFAEHGLGNSGRAILDAYLSLDQDHNIILVDWGQFTGFPWYPHAVENGKIIGRALTKYIQFYNGTGELPISNLHLVGFSIGAHMAGLIGKSFQDHPKVHRITALDPAFPLYPTNDSSQTVAKNDAEFVDVIHTNPGILGFPMSLGQADFYPNGGSVAQPGCNPSNILDRNAVEQYLWCSHLRVWRLYAESVKNPVAFPATKCGVMREGSFKECRFTTDGYMGFGANKNTCSGDYFLTTNNRQPFGKSAKDQEVNMKTVNLVL